MVVTQELSVVQDELVFSQHELARALEGQNTTELSKEAMNKALAARLEVFGCSRPHYLRFGKCLHLPHLLLLPYSY